ncbi:MAG: hypothetical protein MZU95_01095 [Desulfomicrobium escambiense]|nr:hypothetical protein [Desulfomicrobium escambiense]
MKVSLSWLSDIHPDQDVTRPNWPKRLTLVGLEPVDAVVDRVPLPRARSWSAESSPWMRHPARTD